MSYDFDMSKTANPIPPWQRIKVNATTAAQLMSCSRTTFFQRVKNNIYPKAGVDGMWSVSELRRLAEASQPTTP